MKKIKLPREAARAWDSVAKIVHEKFAKLNFPE